MADRASSAVFRRITSSDGFRLLVGHRYVVRPTDGSPAFTAVLRYVAPGWSRSDLLITRWSNDARVHGAIDVSEPGDGQP
jgi:hypothetical protein